MSLFKSTVHPRQKCRTFVPRVKNNPIFNFTFPFWISYQLWFSLFIRRHTTSFNCLCRWLTNSTQLSKIGFQLLYDFFCYIVVSFHFNFNFNSGLYLRIYEEVLYRSDFHFYRMQIYSQFTASFLSWTLRVLSQMRDLQILLPYQFLGYLLQVR